MCPSRPGGSASMATEKAMAGSTDSPGVLIFPPFLFGGSLLLGLAHHWLHPIRLLYLGVALLVDGLAPVVILIPALGLLHRGIVLREERYLEAKSGKLYRAYRGHVRRWL